MRMVIGVIARFVTIGARAMTVENVCFARSGMWL